MPSEFDVKASISTTNARAPVGQFVLHAKALSQHFMTDIRSAASNDLTEELTGSAIERAYVDKGYRGHKAESPRRIFISGQKRSVFGET